MTITKKLTSFINCLRGTVLKRLRGKKSRQTLADEIAARGGECSHQNLKKLEYGESESVSLKVLEAICTALEISISDFLSIAEITIYSL
ncbi:MAG: helix-turn-helix domain-containing protein [Nostoc sp. ChiSLP01]|nr:helix-turn-helix transcriptional regulator [Nostoc sp. CmiSLP01]MDZ8283363.1 helix-turn-helix transcriptional regulator [Nostoc sp. ChiSLP01]